MEPSLHAHLRDEDPKGHDGRTGSAHRTCVSSGPCQALTILLCFVALVIENSRGFVWLYSPTRHMEL